MTVQALVFDAYGTLYDVQSVLAKAEALCPGKGEVITQIWRLKQLEYTWLRSLMQDLVRVIMRTNYHDLVMVFLSRDLCADIGEGFAPGFIMVQQGTIAGFLQ